MDVQREFSNITEARPIVRNLGFCNFKHDLKFSNLILNFFIVISLENHLLEILQNHITEHSLTILKLSHINGSFNIRRLPSCMICIPITFNISLAIALSSL
jgi:hypothetical protein